MLFNYNPFSSFEEREDLYYKASIAGFENLDQYFNYVNQKKKRDSYNAFSARTPKNKSGKTRWNDRRIQLDSKNMD